VDPGKRALPGEMWSGEVTDQHFKPAPAPGLRMGMPAHYSLTSEVNVKPSAATVIQG